MYKWSRFKLILVTIFCTVFLGLAQFGFEQWFWPRFSREFPWLILVDRFMFLFGLVGTFYTIDSWRLAQVENTLTIPAPASSVERVGVVKLDYLTQLLDPERAAYHLHYLQQIDRGLLAVPGLLNLREPIASSKYIVNQSSEDPLVEHRREIVLSAFIGNLSVLTSQEQTAIIDLLSNLLPVSNTYVSTNHVRKVYYQVLLSLGSQVEAKIRRQLTHYELSELYGVQYDYRLNHSFNRFKGLIPREKYEVVKFLDEIRIYTQTSDRKFNTAISSLNRIAPNKRISALINFINQEVN